MTSEGETKSTPAPVESEVYNGPLVTYGQAREAFSEQTYPHFERLVKNQDWYKDSQAAIDELRNSPRIAIDIEAAGARYDYLLVSLGFAVCVPRSHRNWVGSGRIQKFKINLPIPCLPRKFHPNMKLMWWEERCIKEFWSTLSPDLLDQLRHPDTSTDAERHDSYVSFLKYEDAVKEAVKKLRVHIELMPSEPIIVSDNPEFDIGWLNYLIINYGISDIMGAQTAKPNPLRYSVRYGYLTVTDVNDFLAMFDKKKVKDLLIELDEKKEFVHSHDPADDAARMLHKFEVAIHLKQALLPLNDVVMDQARVSKRKQDQEIEDDENAARERREKALKGEDEEEPAASQAVA